MDAVLDAVKFLSAPFDESEDGGILKEPVSSPEVLLGSLIDKCLAKLHLDLQTEQMEQEEPSATWKFTNVILRTVSKLKEQIEMKEATQSEEEKSIEVISLQTQMHVQKCIELIIGFGILPYLMPGLGVSERVRKLHQKVSLFIDKDKQIRDLQKFVRLAHTVQAVLDLCGHPSLSAIILPRHTDDILAAYLQLCVSPIKKPQVMPYQAEMSSQDSSLSKEEYEAVMATRARIKSLCDKNFFTSISKVALVNSLLVIGATDKPRWVAKSCQDMMRAILLGNERGLAIISQAVIESLGRANIWKGARVVTNLVREAVQRNSLQAIPVEVTVTNLCTQSQRIIETMRNRGRWEAGATDETEEQMIQVAVCCGLTLLNICQPVTMEKLWKPLFRPLLNLHQELQQGQSTSLTLPDLEQSIYVASKLTAGAPAIDFPFPLQNFMNIWSLLFQAFIMCVEYSNRKIQDPDILDVSGNLQPKLHSLLTAVFNICDSLLTQSEEKHGENAFIFSEFLISLLLNDQRELTGFSINRYNLELNESIEDSGNNVIVSARPFSNEGAEENILEVVSSDCSVVCCQFFRKEFKKLAGKLLSELLSLAEKQSSVRNDIGSKALLAEFDSKERETCEKFVGLQLLAELGKDESILEDLGTMDDPEKMLDFLELIIGKQVVELESSSRTGEDYEFGQSLMFSLTILSALCDSKKGGITSSLIGTEIKYDWDDLQKFLPHLRRLRETIHSGLIAAGIPNMAEDIMVLIETKGVGGKSKVKTVSRFESALQDVSNPMLPIKGHGLLELRKLIEEKDPDALSKEQLLLQIFQKEMKNEDSYVYLMAIKGMAALAIRFHSSVVPVLVKEYGGLEDSYCSKLTASMKSQERAEFIMKVGEVLVSVVKMLGRIAPVYKAQLTNVFFHLVRDDDPLIRASALSNLGELCHLLKFDLGTVLTEVWYCVEALLQIEKHVEVRRAALHLLVLLLRGVEKEFSAADIVENEEYGRHLRDVRRLITRIHQCDGDTVSKIHCQLALQEIELIVRKLLIPSDKLQYNIRLLDQM